MKGTAGVFLMRSFLNCHLIFALRVQKLEANYTLMTKDACKFCLQTCNSSFLLCKMCYFQPSFKTNSCNTFCMHKDLSLSLA